MTDAASAHSASDQERWHEEHNETLGSFLKRHRTSQGKNLEEIAKVTRIHASTLQAIEEDNPRALPAEVFTKGFIRIYAQHLGLDPDQAITWYVQQQAEEGGNSRQTEVMADIQELTNPEQATSGGRGGKMFLLVLLLMGLVAGYWYWTGRAAQQEESNSAPVTETRTQEQPISQPEQPNPLPETPTTASQPEIPQTPATAPETEAGQTVPLSPPAPAETLPATPPAAPAEQTSTVTPPTTDGAANKTAPATTTLVTVPEQQPPQSAAASQPAAEASQATSPPAKIEPFTLSARFTAKTLMRVRVDGKKEQEASYPPGEHPVWRADRKIVVTIPNPENTSLYLNDKPISLVGKAQKNLTLTFPSAE